MTAGHRRGWGRVFSERPDLYDHFYGHKDYAAEAAHVADLVQSLRPGAGTLLDVACGTGRHLEHLSGRLACEGVHVEEGPRNLLRVASSVRDGQTSVLHMHYVVAEPGSVETADEIHHLGLFSQEEYMTALSAAGLATQWYPVGLIGRGLLAGVAPS